MNPYETQLADLLKGNIAQLKISQEDFMGFREVWLRHPERQKIVGEAGLNGQVIYRMIETSPTPGEKA